jgi:Mrp family chromosome partitioning ATPase
MLMLSFLMMNAAWSATLREHPSARRPAALPGPHMADRQVTMPPDLDSDSLLMEACRALRANLSAGHDQPLPAALMLLGTAAHTSSALVAAGLAATLAEEGRATLLVDADMRQPVLHQIFGIDQAPGLADALEDDHHPPQPWQADSRLWVLPAGQPHRNPAEVLRLPSARRCTSALTGRYETVIYHMVEHPTCSDSLLLARHIDAAVLAIRAGVDTAEGARRIKEALERVGSDVLGFAMMEEPR